MRITGLLVVGLGLAWVSCGDSTGGDLFTPSGTGSTVGSGGNATTGATTVAGSTTGAGGSDATSTTDGTGGGGTTTSGAGGTTGSGGSGGAATTGGGAGDAAAGSSGASAGTAGGSGSGGSAGGTTDGGADAGPDGRAGGGGGGGTVVDAAPDVVRGDVVRCGTTACPVSTQFCCVPTGNAAPRCVLNSEPNNCPNGDDELHCDDRTDCPLATQICCAVDAGNRVTSACRTALACGGGGQTDELCNPSVEGSCGIASGTTTCRADNQSLIAGYPYCH